MRSIKIIADSGSNLNERLCREIDAVSVPLTLTVDGRDFVETFDLDVAEFLEAVEASPNVARSAARRRQPRRRTRGRRRSVCIHAVEQAVRLLPVCYGREGTGQNGKNVHVFDSKSACGGPALQAIKLRSLLDQGLSKSEVIKQMTDFIQNMQTLFVLEDLNPMIKNGRMNKLVGKLVMAMQIRPILAGEDGEVVQLDKARGTKAAHRRLAEIAAERFRGEDSSLAVISHCFNEEGALNLKAMLEEKCSFKRIIIEQTNGLNTLYAARKGLVLCF